MGVYEKETAGPIEERTISHFTPHKGYAKTFYKGVQLPKMMTVKVLRIQENETLTRKVELD